MAAQPATKQWGTTGAISMDLPTDKENTQNDALIAELRANNNYESPEETSKRFDPAMLASAEPLLTRRIRTDVLKSLQKITVEFVKVVGRKKGLPASIIDTAGGKIFTYGSFRLGVFGPGQSIIPLPPTY